MVNDPEREYLGGNEPMGDPAEDPSTRKGGDYESGDEGVHPTPDEQQVEETPREPAHI